MAAFPDVNPHDRNDHYEKSQQPSVFRNFLKASWIDFFIFVSMLSSSTKDFTTNRAGSLITLEFVLLQLLDVGKPICSTLLTFLQWPAHDAYTEISVADHSKSGHLV